MARLFKKNEAVHFKNEEEKKQLLDIAVKHGFKWRSGEPVFGYDPPKHTNVIVFNRKSKKLYWSVTKHKKEFTSANEFLKRFEEEKQVKLEDRVKALENIVANKCNSIGLSADEVDKELQVKFKDYFDRIDPEVYKKIVPRERVGFVIDANPQRLFEAIKSTPHIVSDKNGVERELSSMAWKPSKEIDTILNNHWLDWNRLCFMETVKTIGDGIRLSEEKLQHSVGIPYDRIKVVPRGPKVYPNHMSLEEAFDYQTKIVEYVVGEVNKAESTKIKRHLDIFKKCVETAEAIIKSCQESAKQTPKEEAKEVNKKPNFKPVFMKCTQEQFDRMRAKLESVGCEFTDSLTYIKGYVLTNDNQNRLISFVNESSKLNEKRKEVHTESEFLEACGYVEETIEYTLENIQVDCRGLTNEQIENMKQVVFNIGIGFNKYSFSTVNPIMNHFYFKRQKNDEFYIGGEDGNKHTITYEKFMELFSEKPIEELHAEHKEAKREPKVGDVVKAWDDNKDKFVYGVLEGINTLLTCPYEIGETLFKNIELVTEINIKDFKREKK